MPVLPHHLLLQQNPEWFILLVPAYPGCPGKKAVKWVCVCVYVGQQEEHPACSWVMRCWHGRLSVARCKWLAYGPADATATPSSLASVKPRMFILLLPAYTGFPWRKAVELVSLWSQDQFTKVLVSKPGVGVLLLISSTDVESQYLCRTYILFCRPWTVVSALNFHQCFVIVGWITGRHLAHWCLCHLSRKHKWRNKSRGNQLTQVYLK